MRRLAVLTPLVLLAGALLARRRRRRLVPASAPLAPSPRIVPVALLEPASRFVSVGWTIVAAPADSPRLTLRHACAEGMELDRVDAQETPTQVFVTVLMRWRAPADGAVRWQPEREAGVSLSAPLGTRALVHAPVDVSAPGEDPDKPPLYP